MSGKIATMSEDEKNAQIGVAVSEYQRAKVEVAHVERRIESVFQAYRAAGATMDSQRGTVHEPTLDNNGAIQFGYAKVTASDILNAQDLAALIQERDRARSRLAKARDAMNSLGVTGLN